MAIRLEIAQKWKNKTYIKPTKKDFNLTSNLRVIKKGNSSVIKNQVIKKPWGHEYRIYLNHSIEIWKLSINPFSSTSLHAHPHKDTILLLVHGQAFFETTKGIKKIIQGSCIFIERGALHRTYTKNNQAVLLEIESPPEKNDLIRVQDHYNRNRIGYEINKIKFMRVPDKIKLAAPKKPYNLNGYKICNSRFIPHHGCNFSIQNVKIQDMAFKGSYLELRKFLTKIQYIFILEGDLELRSKNKIYKMTSGSLAKVSAEDQILTHNSHIIIW